MSSCECIEVTITDEIVEAEITEPIVDASITDEIVDAPITEEIVDVSVECWPGVSIIEGSSGGHLTFNFTHEDLLDSLLIGALPDGCKVHSSFLEVLEGFDEVNGFTIGTVDAQALLMSITESQPDTVGTYATDSNQEITGTVGIRLYSIFIDVPIVGKGCITIYFN